MNRFQLALHVLQGRPLVYKTKFIGGITISKEVTKVIVKDCAFVGGGMEIAHGENEYQAWVGQWVGQRPTSGAENAEWLYKEGGMEIDSRKEEEIEA